MKKIITASLAFLTLMQPNIYARKVKPAQSQSMSVSESRNSGKTKKPPGKPKPGAPNVVKKTNGKKIAAIILGSIGALGATLATGFLVNKYVKPKILKKIEETKSTEYLMNTGEIGKLLASHSQFHEIYKSDPEIFDYWRSASFNESELKKSMISFVIKSLEYRWFISDSNRREEKTDEFWKFDDNNHYLLLNYISDSYLVENFVNSIELGGIYSGSKRDRSRFLKNVFQNVSVNKEMLTKKGFNKGKLFTIACMKIAHDIDIDNDFVVGKFKEKISVFDSIIDDNLIENFKKVLENGDFDLIKTFDLSNINLNNKAIPTSTLNEKKIEVVTKILKQLFNKKKIATLSQAIDNLKLDSRKTVTLLDALNKFEENFNADVIESIIKLINKVGDDNDVKNIAKSLFEFYYKNNNKYNILSALFELSGLPSRWLDLMAPNVSFASQEFLNKCVGLCNSSSNMSDDEKYRKIAELIFKFYGKYPVVLHKCFGQQIKFDQKESTSGIIRENENDDMFNFIFSLQHKNVEFKLKESTNKGEKKFESLNIEQIEEIIKPPSNGYFGQNVNNLWEVLEKNLYSANCLEFTDLTNKTYEVMAKQTIVIKFPEEAKITKSEFKKFMRSLNKSDFSYILNSESAYDVHYRIMKIIGINVQENEDFFVKNEVFTKKSIFRDEYFKGYDKNIMVYTPQGNFDSIRKLNLKQIRMLRLNNNFNFGAKDNYSEIFEGPKQTLLGAEFHKNSDSQEKVNNSEKFNWGSTNKDSDNSEKSEKLSEYFKYLKTNKPSFEELKCIVNKAKDIVDKQKALVEFTADQVTHFGDIHGNLTEGIATIGEKLKTDKVVFTGDAIDGSKSDIQLVMYLCECIILYPESFIYLRGNHENFGVEPNTILYNAKFDYLDKHLEVIDCLQNFFDALPIAAIGDVGTKKVLYCHAAPFDDENLKGVFDGIDDLPSLINHVNNLGKKVYKENDENIENQKQNHVPFLDSRLDTYERAEINLDFLDKFGINYLFRGHDHNIPLTGAQRTSPSHSSINWNRKGIVTRDKTKIFTSVSSYETRARGNHKITEIGSVTLTKDGTVINNSFEDLRALTY